MLGLNLSQTGLFSSAPTLLLIIIALSAARSADWLLGGSTDKPKAEVVVVRKVFSALAMLPHAFGLLLLGTGAISSPSGTLVALGLITAVSGIENGGGYSVNHLDIAPRHAGVVQ
eukprot:SAG31_NODE_24690_length_476_cov_0.981432_1_plen_114_part_10